VLEDGEVDHGGDQPRDLALVPEDPADAGARDRLPEVPGVVADLAGPDDDPLEVLVLGEAPELGKDRL
jgi:hypothetical protein